VKVKFVRQDDEDDNYHDLIERIARMPHALCISELAQVLQCSHKLLYQLSAQCRIPHYRIGGLIRFSPKEIADWLRTKRIAPLDRDKRNRNSQGGK
jgi:excisionase family DNA binding protein